MPFPISSNHQKPLMKQRCGVCRKLMKHFRKPVPYSYFWGISLCELAFKKKHKVPSKPWCFFISALHHKTFSEPSFGWCIKGYRNNINPVVHWYSWDTFCENAFKSRKVIGFPVILDAVFYICKLKQPSVKNILELAKIIQ